MFMEIYNIKRTIVFIYNLKAQSPIEQGYKFIVDALVKMENLWVDNFYTILWADRTTIK